MDKISPFSASSIDCNNSFSEVQKEQA